MKRRLLIIAICLLLGAVVNVAVAWGCAGWANARDRNQLIEATEKSDWLQSLPSRRGLSPAAISVRAAIGLVVADVDARTLWHLALGHRGLAVVQWCRSGWPSLAMAGEKIDYQFTSGTSRVRRVEFHWAIDLGELDERFSANTAAILPLKPIWPGFAVNTLFYGTLLWLLLLGAVVLRRFLRLRRGLCPACAYPSSESSVCTECGKLLPSRVRVA